ncbi:hypothetical protein B0J15DRAFT_383808 [Fusarium solani]|uniref:Uncharacterized protein n=1 Tax=Fusarium solani TaxID=169388 RepID=A0A9P9REW1_FUSSL|nr:uncharacterized protein B0J15DRAFT_383808 [Fusarium solani]KAH7276264.1 hypothetical protein B0J15DRAFT_383808 [Fusarium solani]
MPNPVTIGIWAATCTTINTINIVKIWITELRDFVREVRDANQALQRMDSKCRGFQADFELWAKMWGIDEHASQKYLSALWGNTSPKIIDRLESNQIQIAAVKKLSKAAFQIWNKAQVPEDIVPREKLEKARMDSFFLSAYRSRLASRQLYQSCYRARAGFASRDLELEIDCVRSTDLEIAVKAQHELRLRYQFLCTLKSEFIELSVEGPISPAGGSDLHWHTGGEAFYQACLALARMNLGHELLRVDGAGAGGFRVYVPPRCCRIDGPLKPLASLLYDPWVDIDDEPVDGFPRSERLRFALKIAECGLLLSGTTWLVDLRSSNIRSALDSEHNRHFLLRTKAFQEVYNDSHFQQLASHVYAIGILLAELGIGRRIGQILRHSSTAEYTFHLYQSGTTPPPNPYEASEFTVLNTVRINMGDKYAEAVKICLESKESWRQVRGHTPEQRSEKYITILMEYYFEVYSP